MHRQACKALAAALHYHPAVPAFLGSRPHGYVALYRYVESLDFVFVLAVRAQREAGFTH